MYWLYSTHIFTWRNQYVQAKLIDPKPRELTSMYGSYGYVDPDQEDPYGTTLELTYQVDVRHPHPDNYFESAGFTLFSQRLVHLMSAFDVKAEIFPIKMIDRKGALLAELAYSLFHSMESVQNAMDEHKSQWNGDRNVGIPTLVLDESKFEHRPIFVCDHIFVRLMRDDVKQEIVRQGITGFAFLHPTKYRSGGFGFAPDYDD